MKTVPPIKTPAPRVMATPQQLRAHRELVDAVAERDRADVALLQAIAAAHRAEIGDTLIASVMGISRTTLWRRFGRDGGAGHRVLALVADAVPQQRPGHRS
jgi:AraC-like DNA-binding protein